MIMLIIDIELENSLIILLSLFKAPFVANIQVHLVNLKH